VTQCGAPGGQRAVQHRILFGFVCAAALDGGHGRKLRGQRFDSLQRRTMAGVPGYGCTREKPGWSAAAVTAAAAAGRSGAKRAGGAATRRAACATPAGERAATAVPEDSGGGIAKL